MYNDQANAAIAFATIAPHQYNLTNAGNGGCEKRVDNYANTVNTSIVYSANYDILTAFPAGDVGRIILDLYALNNLEKYLDADLKTSINAFLNNKFDNMCGSFSNLTLRDLLYDRVHL